MNDDVEMAVVDASADRPARKRRSTQPIAPEAKRECSLGGAGKPPAGNPRNAIGKVKIRKMSGPLYLSFNSVSGFSRCGVYLNKLKKGRAQGGKELRIRG